MSLVLVRVVADRTTQVLDCSPSAHFVEVGTPLAE